MTRSTALALAVTAALLSAAPARAQAQAVDFTDWSAVAANVASGTFRDNPVALAGSHVWDPPVSEVGGLSNFFEDAALYTPALARTDHIQISGYESYSYVLSFRTPVTDPVLHIASLASRLAFPSGVQLVRVSGSSNFTVVRNTVTGDAGNTAGGTIRLVGSIGSIAFTATTLIAPPVEDGVVLQVGVPVTAETPPSIPPPPVTPTDADGDGVSDAADLCVTVFDPGQGDRDRDRIGDACDVLPPGDVPPRAGASAVASDVRGEVFVKLPARAARATRQAADFVPLKGVASLPMGTTVDARKGSLSLVAAANSRPAADRRHRTQQARLAAGIFRIRQARARRASSRRLPADIALTSAPGAERACAGSTRARPLKRTVRAVSVTSKGFFRAVGGASVGTSQNGTWITTDRCDGTLTEVGRGRVTVRDPRRKRTYKVRAGRGLLVKRPLFVPLKGRGPAGLRG